MSHMQIRILMVSCKTTFSLVCVALPFESQSPQGGPNSLHNCSSLILASGNHRGKFSTFSRGGCCQHCYWVSKPCGYFGAEEPGNMQAGKQSEPSQAPLCLVICSSKNVSWTFEDEKPWSVKPVGPFPRSAHLETFPDTLNVLGRIISL